MSEKLTDILYESDLSKTIFENDEDLRGAILVEAGSQAAKQYDINLINYVCENYSDFIGADYKETHKNILTFAQSAKNQFLSEVSGLIGQELSTYFNEPNKTPVAKIEDYI